MMDTNEFSKPTTRVRCIGTNDAAFKFSGHKFHIKFEPVQTYDGLCRCGWFGYSNDLHEAVEMCEKYHAENNIIGDYSIKCEGEIVLDRTLHINIPITFIGDGTGIKKSGDFVGDYLIIPHCDYITLDNCQPYPDGTYGLKQL